MLSEARKGKIMADNFYLELLAGLDAEAVDTSGIDTFLADKPRKVATISDLASFFRISEDTLVHKAKKDLWRISENKEGEVVIERLFDPSTNKAINV